MTLLLAGPTAWQGAAWQSAHPGIHSMCEAGICLASSCAALSDGAAVTLPKPAWGLAALLSGAEEQRLVCGTLSTIRACTSTTWDCPSASRWHVVVLLLLLIKSRILCSMFAPTTHVHKLLRWLQPTGLLIQLHVVQLAHKIMHSLALSQLLLDEGHQVPALCILPALAPVQLGLQLIIGCIKHLLRQHVAKNSCGLAVDHELPGNF